MLLCVLDLPGATVQTLLWLLRLQGPDDEVSEVASLLEQHAVHKLVQMLVKAYVAEETSIDEHSLGELASSKLVLHREQFRDIAAGMCRYEHSVIAFKQKDCT